MARTAKGDRTALEAELGPRGSFVASSDNRNTVRRWLRARGMAGALVQTLPLSVLEKAYNSEQDFEAMQTIIDQAVNPPAPAIESGGESKPNRFPGPCCICDQHVAKQAGRIWRGIGHSNWRLYCGEHRPNEVPGPLQHVVDETPYPQDDAPWPAEFPKPQQPPKIKHDDTAAQKLQDAIRMIADMATPKAQPLDETRVVELIQQHAPKSESALVRVEVKIGEQTIITSDAPRHEVFEKVLRKIAVGVHVYLVGPAGSGKSTLAEQVAEALERKFYSVNAVKSAFALIGYMDAKGDYVRTAFRDAFEHGGAFLFDEIDGSSPDAIVALNGAMAQPWFAFPDGMVNRHADFVCIAGANTYGRGQDRLYVGRNQLDAASLDRFAFVAMDYDEKLERHLAGNDAWVARVQSVRAAVAELKVRHVVSPRASIMGAKLLAAGDTKAEVEAALIWKGMDDDTRAKVEAATKTSTRRAA